MVYKQTSRSLLKHFKNPYYEKLKLEKHGHIKFVGEDCVEGFVNRMMEI